MSMERDKRDQRWVTSRPTDWQCSAGSAWGVVVSALALLVCGLGWPVGSASAEGVACPNEQLRAEQPYGLGLPDCRAFEMVSPLDKGGAGVAFSDARAAISGEAVTYFSSGSFRGSGPEPVGAAFVSRYLSRRGPSGWSTTNITPPYGTYTPQTLTPFQELLFTPELSAAALEARYSSLVPGEPPGYLNLFTANTENGSYQLVTDVTPSEDVPYSTGALTSSGRPELAGASMDLSHVVFDEEGSLVEGASPAHEHVYEWTDGPLSQVDVPPEGVMFEGKDSIGAPGNAGEIEYGNPWHAVSAEGARVFFTAGEKQNGGDTYRELGQLYVRENPGAPQSPYVGGKCSVPADACTVEVSASQRVNAQGGPNPDPHGPQPAFFRDASTNGSRAFFTSRAELTNDANTGKEDNAANLYEYNVETGTLTDLTIVTGALESEDPDGATLLGFVNAGENGNYVYFVADGVLTITPNSEGETAVPGSCQVEPGENRSSEPMCNLYVEHYNGTDWEAPKFIARLAGGDYRGNAGEENGDGQDWLGYEHEHSFTVDEAERASELDYGPGQHTARVTPDGTRLAFESERSLTRYENKEAESRKCQESETGRCREVYLYDALSGKLVCVSCDRSGARPVGPAELGGQEKDPEGHAFNEVSEFYLPRNLSESGGRLFFQSPDALVPQDSNGRLDVYEWEEDGVGGCHKEEGCVLPISDVAGAYESHFVDAGPNGDDVFIATADQLVSSDTDYRADVYDVRVGGGFPVPPTSPECNNGDSCKPPVSPQPSIFGSAGSATFSGPGNATPIPPPSAPPSKKVAKKTVKCKKPKKRAREKCLRSAKRAKKAEKTRRATNNREAH
jgi:hypothetical protein